MPWRNTGLMPKVLWADARTVIPFLAVIIVPKWWVFYVALALFVASIVGNMMGRPLGMLFNRAMFSISGGRLLARPWFYRQRFSRF